MNDRNYFPFERNRYFYGKLLSVEDFQREQAYMNHKRRLLNRLLYGDGVLCGMQVLEADEESISIEMGVALDSLGREIVIEQPMIKRLSVLDGFLEHCVENENGGILYLCIEYSEEGAEPVHCIGAAGNEEGRPLECNKWKEGFRLFLTSEEPEGNMGFLSEAYEEVHTVFCGQGIRIRQTVPRFLKENQEAVIKLLIDKNGSKEEIFFQYEVELCGADYGGRNRMTLEFREEGQDRTDFYEVEYTIRAASGEMEGGIRILPDSFVLEIGEHRQNCPVEGRFVFQVVAHGREQAIWDAFCQSAGEDILNASWHPPLYLAKIAVIPAGDTYVIEKVENLPYGQYVWNNRLLGALRCMDRKDIMNSKSTMDMKYTRNLKSTLDSKGTMSPGGTDVSGSREAAENFFHGEAAYGVTDISLGIGGRAGQCFFSEEIVHGLGPGAVMIMVGAVIPRKDGREIVYGARSIFPEEKGQINVETAVKLYMDRGSFCIGVRCLEEIHETKLTVYWRAVRGRQETLEENPRILSIRPSLPRVRVRESVRLEALMGEEPQTVIDWRVKEAVGGSIDDKGMYTAPDRPGIYEVRAKSREDERLQASAYVIVVEETEW